MKDPGIKERALQICVRVICVSPFDIALFLFCSTYIKILSTMFEFIPILFSKLVFVCFQTLALRTLSRSCCDRNYSRAKVHSGFERNLTTPICRPTPLLSLSFFYLVSSLSKPPISTSNFQKLEWLELIVRVLLCPRIHLQYSAESRGRTGDKPALTINTLPGDVLREIFAFCLSFPDERIRHLREWWEWQHLVNVCQRWQEIIYAAGACRGDLDRWPELPLVLDYYVPIKGHYGDDHLYNLLAQRNRIRSIKFIMHGSKTDWIAEPMEQQFRQLTNLNLTGFRDYTPNVAYISFDRFLGGSAPSLENLCINNIDCGGLPSLLLSAPNLLFLQIKNIRPTGYVAPEVMVGALAGLTKLRHLCIGFSTEFSKKYLRDERKWQGPHFSSLVRAIFPALTKFKYEGHSEYLEDFVALVDTPRLEELSVGYPKPAEIFGEEKIKAGNLFQFTSRIATFKHAQFRRAEITLDRRTTFVKIDLPQYECQPGQGPLSLTIFVVGSSLEVETVSDAVHVLGQLSITLSDVQHLSIEGLCSARAYDEVLESANLGVVWLPLFRSFPVVDVVSVSWRLAGRVASVLKDMPEETVAEVWPALQTR